MRREDGTGEVGRADDDAGASFGGNVTQSKKGRGIWNSGGYAHGVRTRQRNAQRERRAMRGMGKRELALVLPSESLQFKEGQEEGQAKGRQHSKQMVVE